MSKYFNNSGIVGSISRVGYGTYEINARQTEYDGEISITVRDSMMYDNVDEDGGEEICEFLYKSMGWKFKIRDIKIYPTNIEFSVIDQRHSISIDFQDSEYFDNYGEALEWLYDELMDICNELSYEVTNFDESVELMGSALDRYVKRF